MPGLSETPLKKPSKAGTPPAEAPRPTIGNFAGADVMVFHRRADAAMPPPVSTIDRERKFDNVARSGTFCNGAGFGVGTPGFAGCGNASARYFGMLQRCHHAAFKKGTRGFGSAAGARYSESKQGLFDNRNHVPATVDHIDAVVQINVSVALESGGRHYDVLRNIVIFNVSGHDHANLEVAVPLVRLVFLYGYVVMDLNANFRRNDQVIGER
jgi:hypothetical protein